MPLADNDAALNMEREIFGLLNILDKVVVSDSAGPEGTSLAPCSPTASSENCTF